MTPSPIPAAAHDFDFFFGSWRVANNRLTSRLTGSDTWEQFEAEATCWPILGGLGNVDDFRTKWPGHEGFEGASLRLFNSETGHWSIYWADTVRGTLFPPVMGSFENGVGEFFGEDQEGGIPVRVRFRWSNITPNGAQWEQAFSTDDGATWETNWINTFTRIQDGQE